MNSNLIMLPREMIFEIVKFLNIRSYINLIQTCKGLKRVLNNDKWNFVFNNLGCNVIDILKFYTSQEKMIYMNKIISDYEKYYNKFPGYLIMQKSKENIYSVMLSDYENCYNKYPELLFKGISYLFKISEPMIQFISKTRNYSNMDFYNYNVLCIHHFNISFHFGKQKHKEFIMPDILNKNTVIEFYDDYRTNYELIFMLNIIDNKIKDFHKKYFPNSSELMLYMESVEQNFKQSQTTFNFECKIF